MSVIFVNHKITACGVYQYGLRFKHILEKSEDIKYKYIEVESLNEFLTHVNQTKDLKAIIYNYCRPTLPWVNHRVLKICKNIKSIGLLHPGSPAIFDHNCNIDPTEPENPPNFFSIARPIYENIDKILENHKVSSSSVQEFINKFQDTDIPIFGSFGFACGYKGFTNVIRIINDQFDNAIIKLQMPKAHFYDVNSVSSEVTRCKSIPLKPGIILMINNDFLSNEDLLSFLNSNTMNLFLYDENKAKNAISSVIDVALGIRKPMAISNSSMFRNVYNDSVCVYKKSIRSLLQNSINYWDNYRDEYSHKNVLDKFEKIISWI